MLDTQAGTGNNILPPGVLPTIVIDHHPIRPDTRRCTFTDIRSRYGATSTILYEYLKEAGIEPDPPLATALLYGIRSDTQDLGQAAIQADEKALTCLYPLANTRMLSEIQRGGVPRKYFHLLARALAEARVRGEAVYSNLGDLDNPDMIAEVADLLLRNEESRWSLCFGFFEGKALLSMRALGPDRRADLVIRSIVGSEGTAGGHETSAGGQIPLKSGTTSEKLQLVRLVCSRYADALGLTGRRPTRLVG